MPPINQQGSRTGLITAVVVFVILFVVSAVFAIYFGVQMNAEQLAHKQDVSKYAKLAGPSALTNADLAELAKGSDTAVDVLLRQRDQLSKLVAGNSVSPDKAESLTKGALATARDTATKLKLAVTLPADNNLVEGVRRLSSQLVTLNDAVARAEAQVKDANAKVEQAVAERDKVTKDAQDKIAAANTDLEKGSGELEQARNAKSTEVSGIQAETQKQVKAYQDAANQLQVVLTQRDGQIKEMKKENDQLRARLAHMRLDPKQQMIQQADGEISRLPGNGMVFINIGQQQGVIPGLTFEVYDHNSGVPPLTEGQSETDLPVGKASIEVTRVLPMSSECRIVRQAPGKNLVQGDLIVNLVFDPHTKYNFVVYGDFDLAQTGNASPGDAEVIKRLITQWGGKLQDAKQMNTDTDFVVLGKEPVVPSLSKEDENNPQLVKRRDDAQAALDAYLDIRTKAVQYGIPILDQNRFLYYIGYYEMAKR